MNYGKYDVNKKLHEIKSKGKKVSSKVYVSSFRLLLIAIIGVIVIGIFAAVGTYNGIIASSPGIESVNVVPEGYVTRFFYTDGTVSQTLIGAGGNREYVSVSNLPSYVYNSFVAIEDERFWTHDGIDVRSIIRSVYEVITNKQMMSGASTITQQLIKNQVFSGGSEANRFQKIVRKLQEQYLAVQLERFTSKELIIEYYINTINLGQGSYGIEMAATTYFGKSAQDLTVSEAAVLACIAKSPVYMNPYNYPESNSERRTEVLNEMLDCEFITQEQYDEAIADTADVYQRIHDYVSANSGRTYYTYFTDEVISELMTDLVSLGYSSAQASNLIYTGGLSVYTTQDREIQTIVDEVINDESIWPKIGNGSYYDISYALSVLKADGTTIHYQLVDFLEYFNYFVGSSTTSIRIYGGTYDLMSTNKRYMEACVEEFHNAMVEEGDTVLGEKFTKTLEPQASFVMIDQSTGAVVALSGGRGDKIGNRILDRATDSLRSVGSTFKVLAAYLPAFDTGTLTLGSVLDDSPYFYPGMTKQVTNWYGVNTYKGLNTTRLGISYSMNILACRTIEKVTPKVAFKYLQELGFTTLVEYKVGKDGYGYSDIGVPLALGGLTNGVTNLEMTAAYAAIANQGIYNSPHYYTKVLDHDGNVLIEHKSTPKQVMKSSTSYLLTSAMEDTLKSGLGTAAIAAFQNYEMPTAGKSGTTTDNYDLWFIGYTPYYTAGIWEGFDISYNISNTKTHEIIWREIMERVHAEKELPYKEFEQPSSVTTETICTKCGKKAVIGLCDKYEGGDSIKTEYFAIGTEPTDYCDCHIEVSICNKTGLLAQRGCTDVTTKVLLKKTEKEVWTPVDDDLTTCSPTPTPAGYVLPTATPNPYATVTPTPTPTDFPTPTPIGYVAPKTESEMLNWFYTLYTKLRVVLTASKENEDFFTENEALMDDLLLKLTPTPSVYPTYIATKAEVTYVTSDTKYIIPTGYCIECSITRGLISPTPTPFPSNTPLPTPSPTPEMTYEEFYEFLSGLDTLLNPTPTPTPIVEGETNLEDKGEGVYWYEGEGQGWSDGGDAEITGAPLATRTPTPTPTLIMSPTPTPITSPTPAPTPAMSPTPTPTPEPTPESTPESTPIITLTPIPTLTPYVPDPDAKG